MGALVDGIILGLVLSGMIGPIFFYLINVSVSKGLWKGMMVSLGAFTSDLVLLTAIYYASSRFNFGEKATYLNLIGGLIFFIVGIGGFAKKKGNSAKLNKFLQIDSGGFKPFIHGAIINTFNPGVIIFWIGAMSSVLAKQQEDYSITAYFLASAITVLCIDFIKIFLSVKAFESMSPKIYRVLTPLVSIVLVVFGLNLLRKGIWP